MTEKLEFPHEISTAILALKGKGICHVEIEYSGSGDSGGTDDIAFMMKDPECGQRVTRGWGNNTYECTATEYRRHPDHDQLHEDFRQLMDNWAWEIIGDHHGGFYNNDGGRGIFTLYITGDDPDHKYPRVTLEHSDYITTTEDTNHEWEV